MLNTEENYNKFTLELSKELHAVAMKYANMASGLGVPIERVMSAIMCSLIYELIMLEKGFGFQGVIEGYLADGRQYFPADGTPEAAN